MPKNNKSKFPMSRIRKIMQSDEEIGKVAHVTPIMISKGLELFLHNIINVTLKEATERGSNKLSSQHLKQAILKTEKFDFLNSIVENVPDTIETAPRKAAKAKKAKTNSPKKADTESFTEASVINSPPKVVEPQLFIDAFDLDSEDKTSEPGSISSSRSSKMDISNLTNAY